MTASRGLIARLAAVDWLTTGAFLLTIGAFLGAVLDSYTSLCVVGGDLAHIGQAASCPDVHGWDTRTFPLAVDMGWGGALLATIKLARAIGLRNWRWWAVLGFEILVAGTTVAGNAVHGAVVAGRATHLLTTHPTAVAGIASAVPGVVAVGAGFTLSALISSRHIAEGAPAVESLPAAIVILDQLPLEVSAGRAAPAADIVARPARQPVVWPVVERLVGRLWAWLATVAIRAMTLVVLLVAVLLLHDRIQPGLVAVATVALVVMFGLWRLGVRERLRSRIGRRGDGQPDHTDDLSATEDRPHGSLSAGPGDGHDSDQEAAVDQPPGGHDQDRDEVTAMTAEDARTAVARLVRRARRRGRQVTPAEVGRLTGRGPRQARRLLQQALATTEVDIHPSPARRPRVLDSTAAGPAPAAITETSELVSAAEEGGRS